MNDNVENLILTQLRDIREGMTAMSGQIASLDQKVDEGLGEVSAKVDGVSLMMTMLASHVAHLEERVEQLEGAFE